MDVLRAQIEQVDKMMLHLFEERMELVKEIALYKNTYQMDIEDRDREKEMKDKMVTCLKDEELAYYYLTFLEQVIQISKVYQSQLMNKEN